ncbi:GNAT family N-acetyltransferase [Actinomadura sp. KC06]|uniref:GNAT family N-acetyltransferase n=1 Tax=Actinomadura sp. KC06 TaxID=2530369 RepID=UPI001A9F8DF3|nr:GNAT family N-acetyltransferase [Actinomadura sp. KC06]
MSAIKGEARGKDQARLGLTTSGQREAGDTMPEAIEIRALQPDEIPLAVGVLARGMRDNPLHVAVYGADPDRRLRCHARLIRALFRTSSAQRPIAAVRGGTLVGVTGVAPAGTCQPGPARKLRMLPAVAALGPRTARRVLGWTSTWAKFDPDEPHVHLGPLAVDAHLQGQGVGSKIMREHCARLDDAHEVGYLETDKVENVGFYERFGYWVTGEQPVLGVPNWFMRRESAAR